MERFLAQVEKKEKELKVEKGQNNVTLSLAEEKPNNRTIIIFPLPLQGRYQLLLGAALESS